MEQDIRTEALIGRESLEKLARARVALFGLGGVGGFAAEALVRSGVGTLALVDHDRFSESNLNRQIFATGDMLGKSKVEAATARLKSIRPSVTILPFETFFDENTAFDFAAFDYVIDAIDTVSAKLALIRRAQDAGVPLISCMGTGNKLDITRLAVGDIARTSVCPLARVMRRELKKRGIEHVRVVYSTEEAIPAVCADSAPGRHSPGSMIFVPAAAGLLLAREAVKTLTEG